MDTPIHIVVVDDDPEIRDIVAEYLGNEGFRVSSAADGAGMRRALANEKVDLILLDLRLPGEDGLSLLKELQLRPEIGVIILTGKDDVVDRVTGLELGADDYITKPFHLRELLARARSVLRRTPDSERSVRDKAASGGDLARFAGWEFDRALRRLRSPGGEDVELTSGEFDLLTAFIEHPKRPLTRDQLLDLARGREAEAFDRSIDVMVGRLRRKLEIDPKRPEIIKTVHGVGYALAVDVTRPSGSG
jgi:DNA-binding response OmpR family regulator